jgi:non-homologous end joining protein Ku
MEAQSSRQALLSDTPDKMGGDAFAALRDAMKKSNVAAIARTVLFRRVRSVLTPAVRTTTAS